MNETLKILIPSSCVLYMLLSCVFDAFEDLSGGRVRKIEEKNPELAEKLDSWLERDDQIRMLFKLLLFVIAAVFSVSVYFASASLDGLLGLKVPYVEMLVLAVSIILLCSVSDLLAKLLLPRADLFIIKMTVPVMLVFARIILAPLAPLFGLLSTMIVTGRMSFFSDALGHSGFTGIAIGALCGAVQPIYFAVGLSVLFALLFSFVRSRTSQSADTIIGVFSSTAVALGIFIVTLGGRSFTKFNRYLIGDILSVTPGEIGLLALVLLAVVLLWVFGSNQLVLTAVHPQLASSRGIATKRNETLFTVAIAIVVTLAMSWVGLMVINSLLVLPAAASRNLARNLRQYHLFSILSALGCSLLGLMTAYLLGCSAGATIALYLAAYFAVSFALRGRAG